VGAGDREDHHVQDAAEAYLVWQLQLAAESKGVALSGSAADLKKSFDSYLDIRGARIHFERSDYKENIDAVANKFVKDLAKQFPGQQFDFVNVEKEYRDLKKKGDVEVRFSGREAISISVKNYKNGYKRIQLCSGTWNSFLNNFLFVSDGVGMFVDPTNGQRFSGSDRNRRDSLIAHLGLEPLAPVYKFIDDTNDAIRAFYADDPRARMWQDIADQWKVDCDFYGSNAANRLAEALSEVDAAKVKQRLLVMAGLTFEEELLLIGKGKYLCSLVSDRYRQLLKSVNHPETTVQHRVNGQSLKFTISTDSGEELIEIEVPFTLQKNGAWHLPKEPYKGKQLHPKEGIALAFGERRPKKSRELATSTNTYLDLGRAGLA
jgi:hypothetical protein